MAVTEPDDKECMYCQEKMRGVKNYKARELCLECAKTVRHTGDYLDDDDK